MEKNDGNTTLAEIKEKLLAFREERDWAQFHTPKDLAAATAVEAGELLELFLWKSVDEVAAMLRDEKKRADIGEELADVILFALNFANATGIDVASTALAKIEKNARKYPVEKSKGTARKYTEL